jgi:hypothetical protein
MLELGNSIISVANIPTQRAAWTPSSIAGASWYDISDASSVLVERTGASATTVASVDGPVGTILDKSVNGKHFIAPSDGARPVLRVVSGKRAVQGDGAALWMQTSPALDLTQTWSHVGAWTATTTGHYAFGKSASSGGRAGLLYNGTVWTWRNAADSAHAALTSSSPAVAHVITLEKSSVLAARYNGVSQVAGFAPWDDTASSQRLAIMSARSDIVSSAFAGYFYGGLWVAAPLTAAERTLAEIWAGRLI